MENYYTLIIANHPCNSTVCNVDGDVQILKDIINRNNLNIEIKIITTGLYNFNIQYPYLNFIIGFWPCILLVTKIGLNKLSLNPEIDRNIINFNDFNHDIKVFDNVYLIDHYISKIRNNDNNTYLVSTRTKEEGNIYTGYLIVKDECEIKIRSKEQYLLWFKKLGLIKDKL